MKLAPRIAQASPASPSPTSSSVKWVCCCEDEAKLCLWNSNLGVGGIGQDGLPPFLGVMGAVSPGVSLSGPCWLPHFPQGSAQMSPPSQSLP